MAQRTILVAAGRPEDYQAYMLEQYGRQTFGDARNVVDGITYQMVTRLHHADGYPEDTTVVVLRGVRMLRSWWPKIEARFSDIRHREHLP